MAEAGYGDGFEVTLDCPNNRYVNDEKICQALAAMWAQIGIKVSVNAMPRANYFPKLEKTDTSMYMLGWGGGTTDGIFILQPVLSSYNGKGDGDYNYGRYTNPKLDELVAKIKVDMSPDVRLKSATRWRRTTPRSTISAAPAGYSVAQQCHRGATPTTRSCRTGEDAVASRVAVLASRRNVRPGRPSSSAAARTALGGGTQQVTRRGPGERDHSCAGDQRQ
jgi:hypothetical protein